MLCKPFNLFDVLVILVSVVDLCIVTPITRAMGGNGPAALQAIRSIRVLQLLRVVRIVRLLHLSRELSLLVLGLALSLKAVFWAFLLLFVVMYIGSLFCASLLGRSEYEDLSYTFGSVGSSLYAHFKIITLEAWPDICDWAIQDSVWWVVYFLLYIMVTNLALVNLVTGLIMEGVIENGVEEDWGSELRILEAGPFVETIREIIRRNSLCSKGNMHLDEFKTLLEDPFFQQVLGIYGIGLRLQPDHLFQILDINDKGELTLEELCGGLLRLRGSAKALHPMLLRDDLHQESLVLLDGVEACERQLCEGYEVGLRRIMPDPGKADARAETYRPLLACYAATVGYKAS